ncbi:serine hydroxymethyltransferase [Chelatococcus sp. SYSU_G07232]|uniref:Serine hydroxymethyltransferase n=1 Tax=Chelatococcus albus TaxID=3047466 RepID=A0ABT7AEX3_9HYPH|nr:serine hydroxymethyltransferase [Chelatococcus sp. SYSU_G07232]MDJ1157898.1 serine hydroxymethyltransferase [Chelatococcus sp. SYSU_G07232]
MLHEQPETFAGTLVEPRAALTAADPEAATILAREERRQREGLTLIPSENHAFPQIRAMLGSVFADKYAEGLPGRRYYGGAAHVDEIEDLARARAKALFGAEHANVQPLSGSPMNQAVYFGLLEPGDTILAMDLSHGGHLTHGAPVSAMGKLFRFIRYGTRPGGSFDMDEIRAVARRERPKLVITGFSSYPRDIDYAAFRQVADEVGALAMADVSHVGGLIAGKALANPFDSGFDIVTTTTHKTLRGPRGGLILCKAAHARAIDQAVFPGLQGGPHMDHVAALAVALKLIDTDAYRAHARQVLVNAKALAGALTARGATLVTGGTDNHLMVVDVAASFGVDGAEAQARFDRVGLVANKQVVPDDDRPAMRPSGLRLGTPAVTTRGMTAAEMDGLAELIVATITQARPETELRAQVQALAHRFPIPA